MHHIIIFFIISHLKIIIGGLFYYINAGCLIIEKDK